MKRTLCISLSLANLLLSWHPEAHAQMPCMNNGRACQLPGTSGLGNNMVPMPLGTFNSQFTGSTRPSFGVGVGVIPRNGFILFTRSGLQLDDGTGFTTNFIKSGSTYISEFLENGDQREIQVVGGTLKLISSDSSATTYGQPYQNRYFPTQATDADGYQIFSATWSNGLPVTQVDQLGGRTSFISDNRRNITSVKTPEGLTYTFTYNNSNRLIQSQVGDAITKYTYDSAGNITEVKPPAGPSTLYAYGKDNVLIGVGNGATRTSLFYSSNSVIVESTTGGFTQFSTTTLGKYGRLYLPTKIEGGDGAARSGGSVLATLERDTFGNVTKSTGTTGGSTSYQLVKGMAVKIRSPDNAVVSLTRDATNKYRVTSESSFAPDGSNLSTTDYAWSGGKLASVTNKDSQGRIVGTQTITRSGSTITTTSKLTEYYTYDARVRGRLAGIESAGFKGAVEFDSKGIPAKYVINGVTTAVAREISPNGHVKFTTTRGNLVTLAESNFLGTERNSSFGDMQGRFIRQRDVKSAGTILNSTAAESWSVVAGSGSSRGANKSAFRVLSPETSKMTSSTTRGR